MSLAFLHVPVREARVVIRMVKDREWESERLDFKADFWKRNERTGDEPSDEAAKDIAAFANADGGTLVVGVSDSNDRAAGFNPKFRLDGCKERLESWILKSVAPSSILTHVEVIELRGQESGLSRDVMVVNVPPWPFGVVGARWKGNGWVFPLRVGRDTHFLSFEEAMVRNDVSRRVVYLRLRALVSDLEAVRSLRVRFASSVARMEVGGPFLAEGQVRPIRMSNQWHGAIEKVENDGVLVRMAGVAADSFLVSFGGINVPGEVNEIPENERVFIPLELIAAVWRDVDGELIHIALNAVLGWNEGRWVLRV